MGRTKMIYLKHYGHLTFEPLADKNVISTTTKGCDLLKELGVTYWLSAGSVLGLVREKCGYIKYDTDIDVEILVDDKFNEKKLRTLFADKDFKIIRRMKDEERVMQLAFMHNDIIFDIYFYYDTTTSNYANKNEHGELLMPKRFVLNRTFYDKLGVKLIVPSPVIEYLEYRYGKSWEIPTGKKIGWKETTGEALK